MNKRKLGTEYEEAAVRYLEANGYAILEKNYYTKKGEIDIIAENEGYLCFIEVKYRSSKQNGFPEEAVGKAKIKRITDAAKVYIYMNGIAEDSPMRFDVVSILKDDIRIFKNAFWANGGF